MADAKKCDRCGTFYNKYGVRFNKYPPANAIALAYDTDEVVYYDLCPGCLGKLTSWIRWEDDLDV